MFLKNGIAVISKSNFLLLFIENKRVKDKYLLFLYKIYVNIQKRRSYVMILYLRGKQNLLIAKEKNSYCLFCKTVRYSNILLMNLRWDKNLFLYQQPFKTCPLVTPDK